jgi:hypothetical protein
MHVADLAVVLTQLGFDYRMDSARASHWQAICPRCKRIALATTQLTQKEKGLGEGTPARG